MDIKPLDVLKWIGIVLAAGFVGYFGRYLAMQIIDRWHKNKGKTTTEPTREANVEQSTHLEESRLKLEKKKVKQAAKAAKKAGKS